MAEPPGAAYRAPIVSTLVGFSRELRRPGSNVGSGDILAFCSAMGSLDPSDLGDLYWAGRTTLVTRRESIPVYDEVFRRYFLGGADPVREMLTLKAQATAEAQAVLEVPATDPPAAGHEDEQATLGLMASDAEALRHKSFTACTPEELAALRRIMARIRLTPPKRRTRRTAKAPSGRPRPAPHGAGVAAHARRARRAVLAAAQSPAAAADPDPGRLRLDGRLLAQPAAVRLLGETRGRPGRGVLLRHQAHPGDQGPRSPAPGRRAGACRADRVRLGGRDQDRRLTGRVRQGMGAARPVPRRDRGDLLRRPRPRRPRGPGRGHGTARQAQSPGGMDEPAQRR